MLYTLLLGMYVVTLLLLMGALTTMGVLLSNDEKQLYLARIRDI